MTKQRRRFWFRVVLGVVAVGVGLVVAIVALASRPESVRHYQAAAVFADDGTAQVTETIRYHFSEDRHGIYRVLPDVPYPASGDIRVAADHTSRFDVTPEEDGVRLRIGDPDREVSGEHLYEISYPLTTADLGDGAFGWDGVGASWEVPVEAVELDLVAPWRWQDATCDVGTSGSVGGCEVHQSVPGRLQVSHGRLDSGEGITVYASRGAALSAAPPPRAAESATPPLEWYQRPLVLGGVALIGFVVAGIVVATLLRRAGRDWVMGSTGGAADAAFGGSPPSPAHPGAIRVDDTVLDQWATIEFAPPRRLSPWQGGVVATESPTSADSVAWLLEAAIDGKVDLDESDPDEPVLRRVEDAPDDETTALLEVAFAGRDAITLGSYDKDFTAMWTSLPAVMKQWYEGSGFTDPVGGRRVTVARLGGIAAAVVAGVLLLTGASASLRTSMVPLLAVAVGSLVGGAALALLVRAWELYVRTPAGSAVWLRVESFRRFLAGSEAEHVRRAAEQGRLREYTAWAIALDEVDHWTTAVENAGLEPSTPGITTVAMASTLSSSVVAAGTSPSSSGGGGGGVGGGGGGGGGGSW